MNATAENPVADNSGAKNPLVNNPMIDSYFAALETQLSDLPQPDREDVVRELRAHVLDRLEPVAAVSDDDCRAVLKALGKPDEIARQYRLELILNRAARSRSPWVLFRTTMRWAVTGVQGFSVFMVAFIGYATAASFYITAVLKPFFPHNIGMYAGPDGFNIAYQDHPAGHDIAGPYFIPIAIVAGFLITFVTTISLKVLIRRFGKIKQRIAARA
jgi:hypothetical protein